MIVIYSIWWYPIISEIFNCSISNPQRDWSKNNETMNIDDAKDYLESKLGKQLRIHTDDSRMFVGEFKCTDNVNFLLFEDGELKL